MKDDEVPDMQVHQRRVPAGAPITVPPGAFSSPFAMARQYAGDRLDLDREIPESPATAPAQEEKPPMKETPARGPRGPHLATRAKETLKSCGPLTVDQFAEGLGITVDAAKDLAEKGVERGHWKWEHQPDGMKLVIAGSAPRAGKKTGAAGLKRYLAKKAPKVTPRKKHVLRATPVVVQAPAAAPVVAPIEDEPAFGLFSTGEFRIEYLGQEMRLPRKVTKAMVAYLDKIASAIED